MQSFYEFVSKLQEIISLCLLFILKLINECKVYAILYQKLIKYDFFNNSSK